MLNVRKAQVFPWQDVSGPHEIDENKVSAFTISMCDGDDFPPVRLVQYNGWLCIIDGHHRVAAAKACGFPLSALIVDGEEFEDLDNELRASGEGRADDERYWIGEAE